MRLLKSLLDYIYCCSVVIYINNFVIVNVAPLSPFIVPEKPPALGRFIMKL